MSPRTHPTLAPLLALACLAGQASATDYVVPSAETPTLAFALTPGISPVQAGDTIILTEDGFYLDTYVVEIPDLTIRAADGDDVTINGLGLGSVFTVLPAGSGATFRGLTITNGSSTASGSSDGGGILADAADITVLDCVFTNNECSDDGGAIKTSDSTVLIEDCAFTDNQITLPNSSDNGGAVFAFRSDVTVRNSAFSNNTANSYGGAMYFNDCVVDVSDCIMGGNNAMLGGAMGFVGGSSGNVSDCEMIGNDASSKGGGIAVNNSWPRFDRVRLIGNHADDAGGGVWSIGETSLEMVMVSSVVARNTSVNTGGGLLAESGPDPLILNCTVVNNSTMGTAGGGLENIGGAAGMFVKNCIIRGNVPDQYPTGSSIIAFYCNIGGGELANNTAIIDVDPMFVDEANDDYRLMEGSPSIDAGDSLLAGEIRASLVTEQFPVDIDGEPRIVAGSDTPGIGIAVAAQTVDQGAHEFQPEPGVVFPGCNLADQAAPYGLLDFNDVIGFLTTFSAGCP